MKIKWKSNENQMKIKWKSNENNLPYGLELSQTRMPCFTHGNAGCLMTLTEVVRRIKPASILDFVIEDCHQCAWY